MSEYTPTTEEIRNDWSQDNFADPAIGKVHFDRWLTAIEREAAVRALEEFASDWESAWAKGLRVSNFASKLARACAAEIREGSDR